MRLLLILAFGLTGCVTVHEYCMANLDRFRDYDQCYAEVSAARAQAARGFQNSAQMMTPPPTERHETNCYTRDMGYGQMQTTCQ